MATQSLYRRYRPRRFSEVKGQDHVVRALRNAVINEREGQAYLFSGPRGTGKTTSARILAKVLNCEQPTEGEPCCTCPSCIAVEAGSSYDVHELDAASNNGVEAMRDLIEKAMLGSPGRHKVYILDEVHMLSKPAEAALLKTLEEPPPHVVFVLATTDPQKVSETIRSRTQHLQFHLLPMDELEAHVRWVIEDAGLDVADSAIDAVLRRGGGSARDTLSALEVVAASGGLAPEDAPLDEFVESLIEADPGRALAAVAASIHQGRDARALTESLIVHLRDCFLALMAPDLLQLPDHRAQQVGELAQRLGAATTVRSIERLGSMLVEMRHAPDPRVLLEVAMVQLTNPHADASTAALVARIEQLEQAVARIGAGGLGAGGLGAAGAGAAGAGGANVPGAGAGTPAAPTGRPTPQDPATGRAVLGGRARRPDPSTTASAAADSSPSSTASPGSRAAPAPTSPTSPTSPASPSASPAPPASSASPAASSASPAPPASPASPAASSDDTAPTEGRTGDPPAASAPVAVRSEPSPAGTHSGGSASESASASAPTPLPAATSGGRPGPSATSAAPTRDQLTLAWADDILVGLRPIAKALFAAGRFVGERDGRMALALPNDAHRKRCEEHRADVERALAAHFGVPVTLLLVTDDGSSAAAASHGASSRPVPQAEEDVDISALVDAPKDTTMSNVERVAAAFPGAQLLDEEN